MRWNLSSDPHNAYTFKLYTNKFVIRRGSQTAVILLALCAIRGPGLLISKDFFQEATQQLTDERFWEVVSTYFYMLRHGSHRKNFQQLFYCVGIHCRRNAFAEPSLATTERLMGGTYELRRSDWLTCHDKPSFIQIGSDIQ
jgi:hypothetical protein